MNDPYPASADNITGRVTDGFAQWLAECGGSLAVATYQAGKVALIGWDGRQPAIMLRHFDKPMGIAVDQDRPDDKPHGLGLVTRQSVMVLANSPSQAAEYPRECPAGHDALFLPRTCYWTSDLLIHDIAFAGDELWIVNTRFSCLATLSHRHSFVPRWQPPFISALTPEDRCHLNGLALDGGRARFVTALGRSDTAEGWRPTRTSGGVVIDVESGQIVLDGLCMPHSPRWHDGMLWYLDSGRGHLCVVQPGETRPTVVCGVLGYLRGLSFVGMHAVIGLSLIRESRTFGGLPIGESGEELHCGVAVVDLRTGRLTGIFDFTGGCEEIYDVRFLPGIRHPAILNANDPLCSQAITTPDFAYWMHSRTTAEME